MNSRIISKLISLIRSCLPKKGDIKMHLDGLLKATKIPKRNGMREQAFKAMKMSLFLSHFAYISSLFLGFGVIYLFVWKLF